MRILILFLLFLTFSYSEAKDPHDDDLGEKSLICFNKSLNIDDWGVTIEIENEQPNPRDSVNA